MQHILSAEPSLVIIPRGPNSAGNGTTGTSTSQHVAEHKTSELYSILLRHLILFWTVLLNPSKYFFSSLEIALLRHKKRNTKYLFLGYYNLAFKATDSMTSVNIERKLNQVKLNLMCNL
uniref:(northern house mosquito) hypothetical protein n=1 Tax=Culex pipiens TaxID=7175 RepID=A0A8D8AIS8_CULPI